ncbi:MAG: sigma-54 dependent transcriptional regulator [Cyclobacteriaceae bacterium]
MDIQGKKILLVEDEPHLRSLLAKILSLEGFKVESAGDLASGRELLKQIDPYLLITDVKLPDGNGIDFTKEVKATYPLTEIIVLTAYGNVKDGVRAMKLGAFDYLTKGDGDEKLPLVAAKGIEKSVMNRQLRELEHRLESKSSFAKIIGKSQPVNQMIELAKKVAVTDTTVLLLGDTGTGKELLAEAIHLASRRRKGPFIAINCAAIPKDLQESEMFGHKKGAFTGANSDKKGYFEVANQGTIFLDELGEMNPDLQAKLLRALENRMINRVGDTTPIPIDVRIVAATNKELIENKPDNEFRKDLYYRLSAFTIKLPSLKERRDDINLLALSFLTYQSGRLNKQVTGMSRDFIHALRAYDWPGNIRELKNVIERAVILSDDDELNYDVLPAEIKEKLSVSGDSGTAMNVELKTIEKQHILKVLDMVEGNKSEAAKRLDIGLATLYRKLKEYGLD